MTGLADAGKTGVPQVSPDAIGTVSPISQSAGCRNSAAFAGLETRDAADLEVCGTGLPMKYPLQLSPRHCWPESLTNSVTDFQGVTVIIQGLGRHVPAAPEGGDQLDAGG